MADLELSATMWRRARPREREAVKVALRERALRIGGSLVVDYAQLRSRCGRREQLVLEWGEGGECVTLAFRDPATVVALEDRAPDALRAKLGGYHDDRVRVRRKRRVMRLAIAFALPLIVVLGIVTLAHSEWPVVLVPESLEASAGELLAAAVLGDQGGDAAPRELGDLARELGVQAGIATELHLLDADDVSASALPGGHLLVTTGLVLAAQSAEEMAAVLAHEIGHARLRHSLRGLVRRQGWAATLAVLAGGRGRFGEMLPRVARIASVMTFASDEERAASLVATEVLAQAGIANTTETVVARWQGEAEPPAWLEHHAQVVPGAVAREVRPLAIDWQRVQGEVRERAASRAQEEDG